MAKRIMVIANKWWEADPLCGVLIHDRARPRGFDRFAYVSYPCKRMPRPKPGDPRPADPPAQPRMSFSCSGMDVEVWCVEELMNPAESSSSTLEKVRVLQPVLSQKADLVVAFGTAGSRKQVAANGSVIVGRQVFVHDPRATTPDRSKFWTPPRPDTVIKSALPEEPFRALDEQARYAAEARFIRPPVNAGNPTMALVGNGFVSIGVVNITNYDDYNWADGEAVATFEKLGTGGQVGCIETTHGVIRSLSETPFVYVSGITDTEGLFDFEVTPRAYAQNHTAAHNAGVTLAWLLPELAKII
jgi:hypothetical protein